MRRIGIKRNRLCVRCAGKGGENTINCPKCDGSGTTYRVIDLGHGMKVRQKEK